MYNYNIMSDLTKIFNKPSNSFYNNVTDFFNSNNFVSKIKSEEIVESDVVISVYDNTDYPDVDKGLYLIKSEESWNTLKKLMLTQFYNKTVNSSTKTIGIGQKFQDRHLFCIDFDYKSESKHQKKKFLETVKTCVNVIAQMFCKDLLEACDNDSESWCVNIFGRDNYYDAKCDCYKYGAHAVFNSYITKEESHFVYNKIIKALENLCVCEELGVKPNDLIDKCIITGNTAFWLFGSCKSVSSMYYRLVESSSVLGFEEPESLEDSLEYFEQFFVCYNVTKMTHHFEIKSEEFESFKAAKISCATVQNGAQNTFNPSEIKSIVNLLPINKPDRFSSGYEYLFTVFCAMGHSSMWSSGCLNEFHKFLKKYNLANGESEDHHFEKFKDFNTISNRNSGFNIGTLINIIREYAPENYSELIKTKRECLFKEPGFDPVVRESIVKDLKKRFFPEIKKGYFNQVEDYIKARKEYILSVYNYLEPRVFAVSNPISSVYYNGRIVKIDDFIKTFKNIGTVPGISDFFAGRDSESKKEYSKIEIFKSFIEREDRTIYDSVDLLCSPLENFDRVFTNDKGEKIVNSFTGYNKNCFCETDIPNDLLIKCENVFDDILDYIGDRLDRELVEWVMTFDPVLRINLLLILNLTGTIEETNYVLMYLAQIIQDPNELLPIALLFYSSQGQGKGLTEKLINCIIGDYTTEYTTFQQAFGDHSGGFQNKLVTFINEANATNFGRGCMELLKSVIDGNKKLIVNPKGIQPYEYTNRSRLIFFTNNFDSIGIDFVNQRRFVCFKSLDLFNNENSILTKVYCEVLKDLYKCPGFTRKVYNFFMNYKVDYIVLSKRIKNKFMESLDECNEKICLQWIHDPDILINDDTIEDIIKHKYRINISTAFNSFLAFLKKCNINKDEWNVRRFGRELRDNGYNGYFSFGKSNGVRYMTILRQ